MFNEKGNTTIIPISGCPDFCFVSRKGHGSAHCSADHGVLMGLFPLKLTINTSTEMCKALYFILRVIAWEFTHMLLDSIYQGNLKCRELFTPFGKNCIHCKIESD